MLVTRLGVVFGAAAMLLGGAALAQDEVPADPGAPVMTDPVGDPLAPAPGPVMSDPPPVASDTSGTYAVSERVVRRPAASVQLGGGVLNFVGEGARGLTNVGGGWDLRLGFAPWQVLGFELAYVGSAHDVNAAGAGDGAYLLGNGGEAVLRLNLPVNIGFFTLAPFAFGGAGWTRYDLMNTEMTAEGLRRADDHTFTIPVGAGLATSYRNVYFDARFTYRPTYDEQLFGNNNLDTWGVTAHIGSVF